MKLFPQYWESFPDTLKIQELQPGHSKYEEVKKAFNETMGSSQILKIFLVMHKAKYKDFQYRKESLQNAGFPGLTLNLFHGSRSQTADYLIKSIDGLDPQFSNDSGMWGRGVYFAERAAYSDSYAYRFPDGSKQMMFCEVYVGKYCELAPDNTLRTPPEGYTSVKGHTRGTDIYMVYKNDRSYIDCVITYK